ncbi:hypothetical protein [Methylobacterium isbiliense]|uniref:hypothetical protein n=1 Tax=Methylobacterium isbiliense TaxID=315478 RepID=UPI001EDEFA76|nr:hypothetical protein [Methylobacterium isbiliense]MDN3625618.1 hypothetical protein [Methylobacterium isbiliense]
MEHDDVPRRLADRPLLRILAMGLSAPSFLTVPAMKLQAIQRTDGVQHAWRNVGRHLTRSLGRLGDEPRSR